ncbi:MAG: outer membrane lipoprotein carrier protein LolA [Reyranellaceae bacterium]
MPLSLPRRQILAQGAALLALAASGVPVAAQAQTKRAAPAPASRPLSPQDREDVARVEQYLNSITTLEARFLQVADRGAPLSGAFYIKRPGKLRFQYDPPARIQIVADGSQVTYYDADTDQISQLPTGLTVAKFLVAPRISLAGDLIVTKVERDAALLQITAQQARAPTEGHVMLTFGDKPLQLRRWTVVDGRNRAISVTLTNLKTGGALKDDLFVFVDPDPNRAGRFRP